MKTVQLNQTSLSELDEVVRFYTLSFVLSWGMWSTLILFPQTADWAPLIIIGGAYGPLVAALLLARWAGGPGAARHWFKTVSGLRKQWRWLVVGGLLLPVLIAIVHVGVYRAVVGPVTLSTDPPWYWAASTAPLNILILFWMSSAIEEYGWQGFALPRLSANMHPLLAVIVHGVVWATWHLPLYLTGAWTGENQTVWLLYGITLTLTPVLFWLTRKAQASVLPAVLLHAGTNHYSTLFVEELQFPIFSAPLSTYFIELKVCIYLLLAVILIVVSDHFKSQQE